MPRKIQATYTQSLSHTIICFGDSLTDPQMNMGPEWTRWTNKLQETLNNSGATVKVLNLAQSGAKSGGGQAKAQLNRMQPWIPYTQPTLPYPSIANIFMGTNDFRRITSVTRVDATATYTASSHGYANDDVVYITGFTQNQYNGWFSISNVSTDTFDVTTISGSPTSPGTINTYAWARLDTATNIRAMIRWCQFGCIGFVKSETSLPISGLPGDRYVVLYDTSTTGGRVYPSNDNYLPNITGSITNNTYGNSEPTVWEFRSGQAGETGWGRVARQTTTPTHIDKFVVCNNHFLNYSSGGDTLSAEYFLYDSANPDCLRYIQNQAVTLEANTNIVFCDLFNGFKNYILNGTETAGSYSWHRADFDVHYSELGQSYVSGLIHNTIISKTGWLDSISG